MSRIYSLLPCLTDFAALALGVFCLFGPSLQAAPVINYAGQVAVDGDPFDGQGQFKFALVNADGNQTYWSNDPPPSIPAVMKIVGKLFAALGNDFGHFFVETIAFAFFCEASLFLGHEVAPFDQ